PVLCPDSDVNTQGDFNVAVQGAFNQGALYLQWMGHGNPVHWGGGPDFRYDHIDGMQANTRWPVTGHYACNTGWFVYLDNGRQTLGESFVVRYGDRGSVADLAGAGLHTRSSMWTYDQGVVKSMFQDRIERVGDMVNASKLHYFGATPTYHDVIDTMTLFGDPATRLRLPAAPDLSGAMLQTHRNWLPPAQPVTVTMTLSNSGNAPSIGTSVTMTLPTELAAPHWLSATTSSLVYHPDSHELHWSGDLAPAAQEVLAFASIISPTLTSCGQFDIQGTVTDELLVTTQLSATVNLAVPDVTCDGLVDIVDIQQVAGRWGSLTGDGLYEPRYDLDADDQITVMDVIAAAQVWQ
ncbi:MAG: C25 family cysteine peptidase, partial [Chloroflexota bacterium]|nr:C25 family cysteine peptidase [Chloroflexota bacterium]